MICAEILSTATSTRTKLGNQMKLRMLDALLRMKMNTNISFEKKCCKDFTVTLKIVKKEMHDNNDDLLQAHA